MAKSKKRPNGLGTVYELPSGSYRWQVTLRVDQTGKQIRLSGIEKNKTTASKALAKAIADHNRGGLTDPSTTTVEEWLDQWLKNRTPRLAPKSVSSYRGLIRLHINPSLGSKRIQALKPADLKSYYAELAAKGLSARTQQYIHGILFSAFKEAVKLELIPRNISEVIRPETPKSDPSTKASSAWTAEEVTQFLKVAKSDRMYLVFYLMLTLGLRRGEVLGLKWKSIDFPSRQMRINETLVSVDGKATQSLPKTQNSRRPLRLPSDVIKALKGHRQTQKKELANLGMAVSDETHIFTTSVGSPIHPDNVGRTLDRLATKAKLRLIRVHDLRHTYASLARRSGISIEVLSKKLGHSRPSFTSDVYVATYEDEQDQATLSLTKLLKGKTKKANPKAR